MEFSIGKKKLLSDLLFFDPKLEVIGDVDIPISSLTIDSREVEKGALFFARKGLNIDASIFAVQAIRFGAVAIASAKFIEGLPSNITQVVFADIEALIGKMAALFYEEPSEKIDVIGITGTSGKTTLSFILEQLLESMGKKTGLMGTIGIKVSDRLEPSSLTTSHAITTHKTLDHMQQKGCGYAVLEVSSHALEQKRTQGVNFKAAIFTNLSPEHLDYHKTMQAYAEAKAKLFIEPKQGGQNIFQGKNKEVGESAVCKIANADDPYSKTICPNPTLTYGIDKGDIRAENIELTRKGATFDLKSAAYPNRRIQTPLCGLFNIYNLLAAIATLLDLGFSLEAFYPAIEKLTPPPGRLERIEAAGFDVLIDYAHKPDALEKALETAKSLYKGRVLLVFGCGGQRDKEKRPLMGSIAEKLANHTWITNDNPRREDPLEIAKEIRGGFQDKSCCTLELDRKAAIEKAIQEAKEGDCVIIAGRGHEAFQIVGDEKLPFNDADVVRFILADLVKN